MERRLVLRQRHGHLRGYDFGGWLIQEG